MHLRCVCGLNTSIRCVCGMYEYICMYLFIKTILTSSYSWSPFLSLQALSYSLPLHCGRPSSVSSSSFHTERRRVVNTPASYSGGPGFKRRPGDRLSWLRVFVVFLSPSRPTRESALKLGHDRFLPKPFQYVIHLLPLQSTLYSLSFRKKKALLSEKLPIFSSFLASYIGTLSLSNSGAYCRW
jgi:hypothetical protein